jgi:hypothetical protein
VNTIYISEFSSIIGGSYNIIGTQSDYSSIIGGRNNTLNENPSYSSIIGGGYNTISYCSKYSSIIGGCCNTVSGTSSYSSIIGGFCNTLGNKSCNSVIIGGTGLSLNDECNLVYVPNLKIASVSSKDDASRILVWDSDNVVKYRNSSTLGGVGSISLEPNAGLTNSGVTYATIYNTTVLDNKSVKGNFSPYDGEHPFTWMRGMTAGFLKEKSLVEILNIMLFPTIPAVYNQPTLSIVAISPTFRSVSNSSQNQTLTLNFNRQDAGTASGYTFLLNPSSIINQQETNAASVNYPYTFTAQVPTSFIFSGTVSYQAGVVKDDSEGNPDPPAIAAGTIASSNSTQICTIFPYIWGSVSTDRSLSSFISDPTLVNTCKQDCRVLVSNPPLTIPISSIAARKSYVAIPNNIGIQNGSKTFNFFCETTNDANNDEIPGSLWTYSTTIYPVNICGVNHTYSVYLFNYESPISGPLMFCTKT